MIARGALRWSTNVTPASVLDDQDVQRWWGEKAEAALRECLDSDNRECGVLFEPESCAPDEQVLGSWVLDSLKESIGGLQSAECVETTHTSNPAWALIRHDGQVFEAGKLHQYVDQWRQTRADDKVLGWLENGYSIKVGPPTVESGLQLDGWKGIDKRNGVLPKRTRVT